MKSILKKYYFYYIRLFYDYQMRRYRKKFFNTSNDLYLQKFYHYLNKDLLLMERRNYAIRL